MSKSWNLLDDHFLVQKRVYYYSVNFQFNSSFSCLQYVPCKWKDERRINGKGCVSLCSV